MVDFTSPSQGPVASQLYGYDGQAQIGSDLPLHEQTDQDIVTACMRLIADDEKAHSEWREEARESYEFVAGHQWDEQDMAVLREQLRPAVTFNQIGPFFDVISGAQVNNRQEITYFPTLLEDDPKAEVLNLVKDWARDRADIEDEESEMFRDLLTCGMGWTETRMDYFDDPLGILMTERVSPFEMAWDPTAKKRNLSDAKAFARWKVLPPDEVYTIWPWMRGQLIMSADPLSSADEPVQPTPDAYATGSHGWGYWQDGEKGIKVYCFEWREILNRWIVQTPSGATEVLDDKEWRQFQENMLAQHGIEARAAREIGAPPPPPPQIPQAVRQPQRVWYRAFVAANMLLRKSENDPGVSVAPCPHSSSFKPVTGKKDERDNTFYGIVRAVKDPQRWANKWLSQIMHIMNTSAKSGWVIEEGAVRDIRSFEEDVARPGSVQVVSPGALSGGRLKEKEPPQFPAAWANLMQFAIQSITSVSGMNDEIRGATDRDQSGVVEWQRKRAAIALLAPIFDSLRRYHKEQGRLFLYFLGHYIPPNRAIRVVGKNQKPQIVQMAMLGDTAMYDVNVDEAPTSPNQKSEVWAFLEPSLATLINIGLPMPVWAELLRYSPLPDSTVEEIISALQQQAAQGPPQSPKVQQMQAEMQIAHQKAQQEAQLAAQKQAQEAKVAQDRAALQIEIDQRQSQQQMQIDALQANQEMEIARMRAELQAQLEMQKVQAQMHLDGAKAAHAHEMEQMVTHAKVTREATESQAKAWGGGKGPDEILEAVKKMHDEHAAHADKVAEHLAKHGEALKALREDVRKPKKVIRDDKGRVAGIETKG